MAKKNNELLMDSIGEEVAIAYNKTMIVISSEYSIEEDMVKVNYNEKIYEFAKRCLIFVNYDKNALTYKMCFECPDILRGKLVDVKGKMVSIKIEHRKFNKSYIKLVPIKCITGIKLFNDEITNMMEGDMLDD